MYNEEVDLCYRIRKELNMPLMMTPKASIIHLVGAGNAMDPRRITAMMQSRMHLDRKHYGGIHNFIKGSLTWLHAATRYYGASVMKPMLGSERASKLRNGFAPVVLHPARWWGGFTQDQGMSSEPVPSDCSKAGSS